MQEKSLQNILTLFISAYLIYILSDVLTPFLIALFIAYLINPFISFIQIKAKIKNRGLAVGTGIIITISLLTALFLISIPTINKEFERASVLISEYAEFIPPIPTEIENQLEKFTESDYAKEIINTKNINETLNKIAPLLKSLFSESLDLIFGIFGLLLILLYLIFILLGYPKFSTSWINWVPKKHKSIAKDISTDLNIGMRSYFRGQAIIASIVGILFCIGFKLIGLPMAIFLGLTIGLLNLIPYLQILGFIPAFLLSILHSMDTNQNIWISLGFTLLVFIIIQLIQELILIPKIMKKVTGLHPAIILLSLSIWGSLLGLAGLIIALPITTLIISYYKRYLSKLSN